MPEDPQKRAALAAEHEEVPGMGIAPEPLLNQECEARHLAPHVRRAAGQPDTGTRRQRNHARLRIPTHPVAHSGDIRSAIPGYPVTPR
jgi:hypothetical protein